MGRVGVNERDLEPEEAFPRLGVDQLRSLPLEVGESRVELLASLGAETPVGKFLANRGPGMHHVAYEVDDLRAELVRLDGAGVQLVDHEPRPGLYGLQVALIHPDAVHGVLTELVTHG